MAISPPSIEFVSPTQGVNVQLDANGKVKVSFAIFNTPSPPSVSAKANNLTMLGFPNGMPVFYNGGLKYEYLLTPPTDPNNPPNPLAPPFTVELRVSISTPQGNYSAEIDFDVVP